LAFLWDFDSRSWPDSRTAKYPRRCVNSNAVPDSASVRRPVAPTSSASLCSCNCSSGGQVPSSPRSPRKVMFCPLYISYKTHPMLTTQLSHALFDALDGLTVRWHTTQKREGAPPFALFSKGWALTIERRQLSFLALLFYARHPDRSGRPFSSRSSLARQPRNGGISRLPPRRWSIVSNNPEPPKKQKRRPPKWRCA